MSAQQTQAMDGKAVHEKKAFKMSYSVSKSIKAPADRIWKLLTTADDFPRWNSTVSKIEGTIAKGEKIKVHVPISPDRAFSLKVSEFEPHSRMVWQDGAPGFFRGVRTYTLEEKDGQTVFTMTEVFSGLMLPMIAGSLPDFGPSFEQYAEDLKNEAEKG